jgi:ubiquinone/menaquinone biosynthesis C-methylase UbiE
MRGAVKRIGRPVHKYLRQKKVVLFFQSIQKTPRRTLLDVGGGIGIDSEFRPLYEAFEEVVVLNLMPADVPSTDENVCRIIADGCHLPFPSKSFDWVFSNAVLEHVGGLDQRTRFAAEIRRVARFGYFVTTPNRLFPIEPHTLLPFYQFFPTSWQRRIVCLSPYYLEKYEDIHLLYASELQGLFPESTIVSTGFPVLGTSLVAVHSEPIGCSIAPRG